MPFQKIKSCFLPQNTKVCFLSLVAKTPRPLHSDPHKWREDWSGATESPLHDTQQKFISAQNEQHGCWTPSSSKAFCFCMAVWHTAVPTVHCPGSMCLHHRTQTHKRAQRHQSSTLFFSVRQSYVARSQSLSVQCILLLAAPNSVSCKMTFC